MSNDVVVSTDDVQLVFGIMGSPSDPKAAKLIKRVLGPATRNEHILIMHGWHGSERSLQRLLRAARLADVSGITFNIGLLYDIDDTTRLFSVSEIERFCEERYLLIENYLISRYFRLSVNDAKEYDSFEDVWRITGWIASPSRIKGFKANISNLVKSMELLELNGIDYDPKPIQGLIDELSDDLSEAIHYANWRNQHIRIFRKDHGVKLKLRQLA